MTKKIKTSKGDTDVKSSSTILYSPNIIDFSSTGVSRGRKGNWCEFQLFGTSNTSESEYRAANGDAGANHELMEQIRNRSIGRKIRMLDLDVA